MIFSINHKDKNKQIIIHISRVYFFHPLEKENGRQQKKIIIDIIFNERIILYPVCFDAKIMKYIQNIFYIEMYCKKSFINLSLFYK
jgi:hypothetical protein